MTTLALDTSSNLGSIALLRDDTVLAETDTGGRMEHSAQLFPRLDSLLKESGVKLADIELYAVGIGPGSFNGIRIGIAALKGLRLATDKPTVGVSSADALAEEAVSRCPAGFTHIAVITDARRGEWYFSLYKTGRDGATRLGGDTTVAPEKIPSLTREPTYFVGPDNAALCEKFSTLRWNAEVVFENKSTTPRATIIGKLGVKKFLAQGKGDTEVEPIYLRQAVQPPVSG